MHCESNAYSDYNMDILLNSFLHVVLYFIALLAMNRSVIKGSLTPVLAEYTRQALEVTGKIAIC